MTVTHDPCLRAVSLEVGPAQGFLGVGLVQKQGRAEDGGQQSCDFRPRPMQGSCRLLPQGPLNGTRYLSWVQGKLILHPIPSTHWLRAPVGWCCQKPVCTGCYGILSSLSGRII